MQLTGETEVKIIIIVILGNQIGENGHDLILGIAVSRRFKGRQRRFLYSRIGRGGINPTET